MKRTFIGLIRDHRTRIGRIRATRKVVPSHGSKGKVKNNKERQGH